MKRKKYYREINDKDRSKRKLINAVGLGSEFFKLNYKELQYKDIDLRAMGKNDTFLCYLY